MIINLVTANNSAGGFNFLCHSALLLPGGARRHRVSDSLFLQLLGTCVSAQVLVCGGGTCGNGPSSDKRRFTIVSWCIGLGYIKKFEGNKQKEN